MSASSKFLLNLVVFVSTFYSSDCLSEIKNCGGRWTNGPCDEDTAETFPESKSDSIPPPDMNNRRSLYTDLDLRNFRAKREYGVEVSLEDARVACLSDRASLKECRKVTTSQNERLDNLIAQTKQIPAPQPTTQTPVQDQNQVVIINNNDNDDDWRRKWRWRKKKDRSPDTYDLSDKHQVDEGTLANQAKIRRDENKVKK